MRRQHTLTHQVECRELDLGLAHSPQRLQLCLVVGHLVDLQQQPHNLVLHAGLKPVAAVVRRLADHGDVVRDNLGDEVHLLHVGDVRVVRHVAHPLHHFISQLALVGRLCRRQRARVSVELATNAVAVVAGGAG
jgi:hypothetical protein